jgi:DNA polymerase III sliding clamp (beta) subunit (PCNA family)
MKEENMTTIQETKLDTLTIGANDLMELLTGASVAMDKGKDAISRLGSIYLSAEGGKVKVKASDRYRLIVGETTVGGESELSELQIRASEVKNILTTIKANKVAKDITLTRAGDSLSVAIGGTSLSVYLGGDTFPPYEHLLGGESLPVPAISFNATYMADFAKVPCSHKGGHLIMEFTGEAKPIRVKIPHDKIEWVALLMPMRVK